MKDTLLSADFTAFGLNISSEILLPELYSVQKQGFQVDIEIKYSNLSKDWFEVGENNNYYCMDKDTIMFKIPNVAIFLVKEGKEILVSPMENVHEDQLRLYILGTCMGLILLQRKILPLHGSAIEVNGKAYAIVGDSGAGKSTLATAFLNRGHQLISDDVIPVMLTEGNVPVVTPAYPQQKLWKNSLEEFGIELDGLRPIIERETKFAIPVHSQFATKQLPLAGVYELTKTENELIDIQPINSLERLQVLYYHTYRNFFLEPSGLLEWHFTFTTSFVNNIQLYQIRRPINRFTAQELYSLIISTINQGE